MVDLQMIVYVLQLEQGKYYIGKTHSFDGFAGDEFCFRAHLEGRGCAWTKKYKPVSIIESHEYNTINEVDDLTKKYMMKYGIANVRGEDSYTIIELDEFQVKTLKKEFDKQSYLEYLSAYNTEQSIEEEITRLEKYLTHLECLHKYIDHYKYVKIMNDKREIITIEIEPSIIDTYDMRTLKWDDRRFCDKNTNEQIYAQIVLYKGDDNKPNIVNVNNVVQNIYKVYIYRKKLEREYLILSDNELHYDKAVNNINNKIEYLYEKLASLI